MSPRSGGKTQTDGHDTKLPPSLSLLTVCDSGTDQTESVKCDGRRVGWSSSRT